MRVEFVDWSRSPDNNRASGHTRMVACGLLGDPDRPWQRASQVESKGCGATMRVAPLGLVPGLDDVRRAGGRRAVAGRAHPRPSDGAGRLRPHRARGTPPRARHRPGGSGRAAALVRRGEPDPLTPPVAGRPVDARRGRGARAVHRPRPGRVPGGAGPAGAGRGDGVGRGRSVRGHRGRLDRRGGPGDRSAVLPALPRRARHRPAPCRLHPRRLRLPGLPGGRLRGRAPGPGAWSAAWTDRIEYRDELLALGALWDA